MREQDEQPILPVNLYRSEDRVTVAAPMPGIEPDDISVEVTDDGRLILWGALRGELKGVNEILLNEWRAGGYHRELRLPSAVDGVHANVTYGNGVLVVSLPVSDHCSPARLTLTAIGPTQGEHAGNAGHPVRPFTAEEHRAARDP
ncbi:MAG: Hsp20/alpha crystallin family protein [Ktedonobacterales bacterium]|nr:Hsp20/alpha crystallin family protein [Ktedonobacterales bacterium]